MSSRMTVPCSTSSNTASASCYERRDETISHDQSRARSCSPMKTNGELTWMSMYGRLITSELAMLIWFCCE
jgi:hypothetical protein